MSVVIFFIKDFVCLMIFKEIMVIFFDNICFLFLLKVVFLYFVENRFIFLLEFLYGISYYNNICICI